MSNRQTEAHSESPLDTFCKTFGVNEATAIEMMAFVEGTMPRPTISAEAGLKALRALEDKFRQAFHYLVSYQANQKTVGECRMSTRAVAFELGLKTVAGADDVADLGRKTGFKKQTVGKCSDGFRRKLGLPPRPEQRKPESKKKMSRSRKASQARINEMRKKL